MRFKNELRQDNKDCPFSVFKRRDKDIIRQDHWGIEIT